MPGRMIPAGTVAGIEVTWTASSGGRDVVDLVARWAMTSRLDIDWEIANGYHVQVHGDPTIDLRLGFIPGDDARTIDDLVASGQPGDRDARDQRHPAGGGGPGRHRDLRRATAAWSRRFGGLEAET